MLGHEIIFSENKAVRKETSRAKGTLTSEYPALKDSGPKDQLRAWFLGPETAGDLKHWVLAPSQKIRGQFWESFKHKDHIIYLGPGWVLGLPGLLWVPGWPWAAWNWPGARKPGAVAPP